MGLTGKQKQRIESVFHEALKLVPQEREKFLANACADDDTVRQEAASLVRHYESASDLEHLGKASQGLPDELPLPERIGPYDVQGRLGRGGMGEVYLARDPRLGRKVAIKVISPAIAETPEAMQRLRREAMAASALNHPNILTVYEFGEAEGRQYIVTEYVEGESLREKIGELAPEQVLDYARQISEALSAAHKAGIIHRDIKPENLMVRPDGYVKVLDFGLAKAAPIAGAGTTSIQQRLEQGAATAPGILVGTISYMSPEQVRGQEVDQRTDIWSWGVVLYEMLTGRRPFEGETSSDVIAAILERDPLLNGLPRQLTPVLNRALAKRKEDRFSEICDVLSEVSIAYGGGNQSWNETEPDRQRNWQRYFSPAWFLPVVLLLASLAIAYRMLWPGRVRTPVLIRVTNTGDVTQVGISPDSDYVAYAVSDGRKQSLRVRDMRTGADVERLEPVVGKYTGITFSSGYIYFVVQSNDNVGRLYRIAMLSGTPKLIAEDVDSPVSFAPDKTRCAFMRMSEERSVIVVRSLESNKETVIAALNGNERFWSTPLWSSDGKTIVSETFTNSRSMGLRSIRISDGQQNVIAIPAFSWLNRPAWRGQRIVLAGATPGLSRAQLFDISPASGKNVQLTKDLANYGDVDSSAAGDRVVAVQEDRISPLWITSLDGKTEPKRVTATGSRFYGVTWAADDRLISLAESRGRPELWFVDASTGKLQAITEDAAFKQLPEASPAAKQLIYSSDRDGAPHIWRSNLDGSGATRLTGDEAAEEAGSISPDGSWVVYTSLQNGFRSLRRVSIHGGESQLITAVPALNASVSPDGMFILCEYLQDASTGMILAILRASDGNLVRAFPTLSSSGVKPRWSVNGKELLFVRTENGVSNIWAQPVDGGNPTQMTHFIEDEIFSFALSPDAKSIACVRGKRTSDAIVLETN
jgi:eukaryotic-like serine/threonine-protein kinase